MQLGPAELLDADTVLVTVPPTRSDILHAVDIAEDVAIAYGTLSPPISHTGISLYLSLILFFVQVSISSFLEISQKHCLWEDHCR
jgi:phenylalanyl-tRNA synthetase beta chain